MRGISEARSLASFPRPDAIWIASRPAALAYAWVRYTPLRRPLFVDLDWTLEQREAWAPIYERRPPRVGMAFASRRLAEGMFRSGVTQFFPWSEWAADGLRSVGVEEQRIRTLVPGVDTSVFRPQAALSGKGRRLRLLFVGGELERKGGDILLQLMRGPLGNQCELDIVTRDEVPDTPSTRVHRLLPGSTELTELYARADLFVMPSRAECFGIATIEALASGLPVIVGNTGASPEIVRHDETGWLVKPTIDGVRRALETACEHRHRLPLMGRAARRDAEVRFDSRANDAAIVSAILEALPSTRRAGAAQLSESA